MRVVVPTATRFKEMNFPIDVNQNTSVSADANRTKKPLLERIIELSFMTWMSLGHQKKI